MRKEAGGRAQSAWGRPPPPRIMKRFCSRRRVCRVEPSPPASALRVPVSLGDSAAARARDFSCRESSVPICRAILSVSFSGHTRSLLAHALCDAFELLNERVRQRASTSFQRPNQFS